MGDFFKALLEKLRVDLLLTSSAIAILLFKLLDFDVWWMIFTFCSFYILLLVVEWAVKFIREKNKLAEQNIARIRKMKNDIDEHNDIVWKHFYALDNDTLDLLKRIYLAEKDSSNPLTRYIEDRGSLMYEIAENRNFRISLQNRTYCPLLSAERIANKSVVTFHPYYMELVARYVNTGKKERV